MLFTAGQADVRRFVIREAPPSLRTIAFEPPRSLDAGAPIVAMIVADRVSLKTRAGNVAPGCAALGPGLASPRGRGELDLAGLRACATRLKAASPDLAPIDVVTIAPGPATPAREIFDVADALRGSRGELFPRVADVLAP